MAVLVDDPDIIESVRKLAAQMQCPEEEAIGYAVALELRLRRERTLRPDDGAATDKLADQGRPEAEGL